MRKMPKEAMSGSISSIPNENTTSNGEVITDSERATLPKPRWNYWWKCSVIRQIFIYFAEIFSNNEAGAYLQQSANVIYLHIDIYVAIFQLYLMLFVCGATYKCKFQKQRYCSPSSDTDEFLDMKKCVWISKRVHYNYLC